MKLLLLICKVFAILLLLAVSCPAQSLSTIERLAFDTHQLNHATIHIVHGNIYREDARTGVISKFLRTGQIVFAQLPAPGVGRAVHAVSITEDAKGNVYLSDGVNIHTYSLEGRYLGSFSPGINLSTNGVVVIDQNHFFLTGRMPAARGGGSATIFEVAGGTTRRSFGTVPFPNLAGVEDAALNTDNMLAFDAARGLLYELSPYLYEIHVYTPNGDLVRSAAPPAEFRLRPPNVRKVGQGVGLDPSDALTNLFVLPDGGLAVEGMQLQQVTGQGNRRQVTYSTFVDIYDARGQFVGRMDQGHLKAAGTSWYCSVDKATGDFYFADDSALYRARPHFSMAAKK